jgi:hypothetical protein
VSAPTEPAEVPEPRFLPGTLVVYRDADDKRDAYLAVTASDPVWWAASSAWGHGLHYVQFPERGYPSGGSSYYTSESKLRLPETAGELLAAARYQAAARVRDAKAELATAERERDAIETVVTMVGRSDGAS